MQAEGQKPSEAIDPLAATPASGELLTEGPEAPTLNLPALESDLRQSIELSSAEAAFLPVPVEKIEAVARMLSNMPGIPKDFRGKPENCQAVVLQAAVWRISALFLLQGAYQAKADGPIGYEAKVLHAVILANAPLSRRPQFRFGYGGDGKPTAANRFCEVTYWITGKAEPERLKSPTVAQIKTKNSPLWLSHPDLQLIYYIGRAGARAYFPDVLGGAYTREEVIQLRDMDVRHAPAFEEDEAEDAEFEDSIPPTEADAAAFDRWEKAAEAKASGQQDSRDPRDDPRNREPSPPPEGSVEPDDLATLRHEAADWQRLTLAKTDPAEIKADYDAFIKAKAWGRLKAYDPELCGKVKASVMARLEELRK